MHSLYHYTNRDGFNGIHSQPTWRFRAAQPPPLYNPAGAYFTPLGPETPKLAKRLRIPNSKLAYYFNFRPNGDQQLFPLQGNRGRHSIDIVYSPVDYYVIRELQIASGAAS